MLTHDGAGRQLARPGFHWVRARASIQSRWPDALGPLGDGMPGFRLLPLGVGDAFSARHYSSCLALEADGEWLLVDCPHPIRKLMYEGSAAAGTVLDVAQVRAVVLTHLHADHASGLEGIGFYARFILGRSIPVL